MLYFLEISSHLKSNRSEISADKFTLETDRKTGSVPKFMVFSDEINIVSILCHIMSLES